MKEAVRSKLAADFPRHVLDQAAESRAELIKQWTLGETAFDVFAKKQVEAGLWEKVWKRIGSRLVPAYRRPKG